MTQLESAWAKLVEIQEKQTTQSVQQTALLERIVEYHEEARERTTDAVAELKNHVTSIITSVLSTSELWWRRAFWIAVALVVLSNLLGVAINKYTALLK